MISVLGRNILTSGIFRSSAHLSGIFSIYLMISYEKYPTKRDEIGGTPLGKGKLKL